MIVGAESLVTVVCIAFLIVLAAGPWQDYATYNGRQKLFMVRNSLFDFALDGQISFDDPVYRDLRAHIESLIRFAHRLSLWRFLYIVVRMRRSLDLSVKPELLAKIQGFSEEQARDKLCHLYEAAGQEVLIMILQKSVFMQLVFYLVFYVLNPTLRSMKTGRCFLAWLRTRQRTAAEAAHALPQLEYTSLLGSS